MGEVQIKNARNAGVINNLLTKTQYLPYFKMCAKKTLYVIYHIYFY